MSRAFVKEEDDGAVTLPDRPISTHPNLVTEAGRAAIENALHRFEAAHKAAIEKGDPHAIASDAREIRYWSARMASAQIVKPSMDTASVHFGQEVTLSRADGRELVFRIVGEDEADPSRGTVSHAAPVAQAVLGHALGETVEVGEQEAVIIRIR